MASAFAALGDPTRLSLMMHLCDGEALCIRDLVEERGMTRQAITKHLKILESRELVHGERQGREVLFQARGDRLLEMGAFLEEVGQKWDNALTRLKHHLESKS
jgi:DNA-binding transcriptional ArsR family regulator